MPFILKLKIEDPHLEDRYTIAAEKHNKMIKESAFPDSGFDLYSPVGITCDEQATSCATHLIDLGIK